MVKEYKNAVVPETGRVYSIADAGDGKSKIVDSTEYTQEGSTFGAEDILSGCEMEFTHSKLGTVHNFENPNATAFLGRAKMTADVGSGDTFTVNGVAVTAYMGADSAASSMAGSAYNGKWVTFVYDSEAKTLNFKGGGGRVTVEGLSADVILTGSTVTVKQGTKTISSVVGTLLNNSEVYSQRVNSADWTTTTKTYGLKKGDLVLIHACGTSARGADGGAPSDSSISAPKCQVIMTKQVNFGNGEWTGATLSFMIAKALEDTTITMTAYCGTARPIASFYIYKLN